MSFNPPPGISFGGSDDEDDGDTMGAMGSFDPMAQTSGALDKSFMLSQSGAFKLSDFQIRAEGGLTTTAEAHSPEHAHPAELLDEGSARLQVDSLDDLEMLEELASSTTTQWIVSSAS